MNQWRLWVLAVSMSILAQGASNDPVVPVVPTVLFLSREADPYLAPKPEVPTMANIRAIVNAARTILKLDASKNPEYSENVVILDEGNCWFVSFHARGNGNVRFEHAGKDVDNSAYFLVNTNAGVYLDKKSLTKAKRGPRRPIQSLPLISPTGEQVKGAGLVVESGEAQPNH
ncbi:MAG TPA: hypothetical protein PLN52_06265 [Opitutaceae bacterium]|nr:hypothetical protein [Opitutaceae bacterium]